jgi:hypothetical protein
VLDRFFLHYLATNDDPISGFTAADQCHGSATVQLDAALGTNDPAMLAAALLGAQFPMTLNSTRRAPMPVRMERPSTKPRS